MKKAKHILIIALVVSMIWGTTVFAEGTNNSYPLSISIVPEGNVDLNYVAAGDKLSFKITVKNISTDTLGGFYLSVYSENSEGRCGDPIIREDDIPEVNQYNNGAKGYGVASALFENNALSPQEEVSLVATYEVKEEMIGDTITISTKASYNQGADLSDMEASTFKVVDGSIWVPIEVEANEVSGADLNNLVVGQKVTFKIKVTNPNATTIQNVLVGMCTTSVELENAETLDDFGKAASQDGIKLVEGGASISELGAGKSVEITVEGTIAEKYSGGPIYFISLACVTETEDIESDVIGADASEIKGNVVKKTDSNVSDTNNSQTQKIEKSPQTGDKGNVTFMLVLMLLASATIFVVLNKKKASI